MSRGKDEASSSAFREELLLVRFPVDVEVAEGTMSVRDLLALDRGAVVRSRTRPGGAVRLVAGGVRIATAEARIEKGLLELRIESIDGEHG